MKKQKQAKLELREVQMERHTSSNGKRRLLKMTELIEKDGFIARAQKKYVYFITERLGQYLGANSLQEWMAERSKTLTQKPRHISVKRIFNKEHGIGQTTCRTSGSFYVVKQQKIFAVAFLHTVKFDILGPASGPAIA
ncbi:MAG: hypothetical protein KBD07_00750 [Candidatus Omnitrophica bacterium]|jgi:hypothetical protein|nr:hypothetical protein [Candidatus Omnitrophota bacterium]